MGRSFSPRTWTTIGYRTTATTVPQQVTGLGVADTTAAAKHPELGDGYEAALTNFRFMASAVLSTEKVLEEIASTEMAPAGTAS